MATTERNFFIRMALRHLMYSASHAQSVYDMNRDVGLTSLLAIHSRLLPLFRDLIIKLVSSLEVLDFENEPIPELSLFPKFAELQHTMEQAVSAVVSVALRPDQPDIEVDGNCKDFKIFRTSRLLEDIRELQDLNWALFEVLSELIQGPAPIDDPDTEQNPVDNQDQDIGAGWRVIDDPDPDQVWVTNPNRLGNQEWVGNQDWFGNQDWGGVQDWGDNQDGGANRDWADNHDRWEDPDQERNPGNDNANAEQANADAEQVPEDTDAQNAESSGKEESWTSKKKREMISRATLSTNFIDAMIRRCKQSDFALLHETWQAAIGDIDHALSFFCGKSPDGISRRDDIARLTRSAIALMKVTRVFYSRLSNTSTHLLPFTLPHDVSSDELELMLWKTAPLARIIDDELFVLIREINCVNTITIWQQSIITQIVREMHKEFTVAWTFLKRYLVPLTPKAGHPSSAPFVFDDHFQDLKDQFYLACDNTIEFADKVEDPEF
ncbi:uncharacterized protein PGTG_07886 [Puccinia graminis f. sp. tritici CRL 75-36-700-3]|uniref:Uncharacterized protein n=1 Tax=Puccinia graminis f. sp. tritici (strain CRL 75-36-700-3 / race SCCL) TaxID=418459 RepID=E3KBC4_PUCGT|nr:uncharacterized protein PGTG_07886 [Puccinia graminis f. sp. tritici CRL 75-36-700-3]EFP81637.1 hypothetical protein PGTG_07886 [Puccinia graminis f. sp. tritici CRL 75-36-700-3]